MYLTSLSKEVSYALRHAPWEYELEPDAEGFVPGGQLLTALNETGHYGRPVTAADLEAVVDAPGKRRHEIRDGRIRALYGHSFPMQVAFEPAEPPEVLYHGTARRFVPSIMAEGLKPMSRQYVHLSADVEMARQVGSRHDRHDLPVILRVDAAAAHAGGVCFYPTGNDRVWLCDALPARYLEVLGRK